jgi:hypothetical protein
MSGQMRIEHPEIRRVVSFCLSHSPILINHFFVLASQRFLIKSDKATARTMSLTR